MAVLLKSLKYWTNLSVNLSPELQALHAIDAFTFLSWRIYVSFSVKITLSFLLQTIRTGGRIQGWWYNREGGSIMCSRSFMTTCSKEWLNSLRERTGEKSLRNGTAKLRSLEDPKIVRSKVQMAFLIKLCLLCRIIVIAMWFTVFVHKTFPNLAHNERSTS